MVKIGNAMKAVDDGKWFVVNAEVGEFRLKIKPVLPAERYYLNKEMKRVKDDLEAGEKSLWKFFATKIIDWSGLTDANDKEMPFSEELVKDEKFLNFMLGLKLADDGGVVSNWLLGKILSPDAFVEEATESFLANT